MEMSPELQKVLDELHREHQHTRIVFGLGIIVLCLVTMFIAPSVIRSSIRGPIDSSPMMMEGMNGRMMGGSMGSSTMPRMMQAAPPKTEMSSTSASSTMH